mmetsp:Transcript_60668/g.130245  ORF Transcript_60668/g.130245 Transcript_60668/m.130245 type:complete len:603 (-) Transcript_60668:58-1866(-)
MGRTKTAPDYHGDLYGTTPLSVTRTCTDWVCVVIFGVLLAGLAWPLGLAKEKGDLQRFYHLPNSDGKLCGVDEPGQFLYFCGTETGEVGVKESVCVASCPAKGVDVKGCPESSDSYGDTKELAGMLCMPTSQAVKDSMSTMLKDNATLQHIIEVSSLAKSWQLLAIAAVGSVLVAGIYLLLVKTFAVCFMWIGMGLVILVTGAIGGYLLLYVPQHGGVDGVPSTGDSQQDMAAGIVASVISFLFLCFAVCQGRSLNSAVKCIEEACECIFMMPGLVLEPFVALAGKVAVLVPMGIGFLAVLSIGTAKTKVMELDFSASSLKSIYTDEEYCALAFYFFMMLWVSEICHSLSVFVVAYTVEVWYFHDPKDHFFSAIGCMCRGYFAGATFHLGSMIFGAVIIATTTLLQIVLGTIAKAADDTGNPIAGIIATVCLCCVTCWKSCLEGLNKTAYMDIAMNSTGFCHACKHAFEVLTHDLAATATLKGATVLFQVTGLGGIAAGSAGLVWAMAKYWPKYSDPASEDFVEDPTYLCFAAAVVSFIVSLPVMHVFDTVSETLLYCKAYEAQRAEEEEEERQGACSVFSCCKSRVGRKSPEARSLLQKPK